MTDTRTSTSPYLSGNFAPVHEEVTAENLDVTGHVPEELNGRYLRIGPNPLAPPDPSTYHWFTGDGMVHGVHLRDGRAEWYRNRWIRSNAVSAGLGEEPKPGERHGGFDTVNTNVIGHASRTFALVEAGARPVELTYELDTVCHTDLDGTLPNGYTAHPKRDPETGELFAAAYYWALPYVQYLVIGTDGKVRKCEPIEVHGSPMMHDMSLTERHAVLYDLPVAFSMEQAAAGVSFPYRWDPTYPARLGVLPREGTNADVRWFEIEPCYVFHPLNAYDTDGGSQVVLEVVRYPRMFDRNPLGPAEGASTLWRWTIDLADGAIREEQLDDRPCELPRVDERVVGRPHRFGYAISNEPAPDGASTTFGGALYRYDATTGRDEVRRWGPRFSTAEVVFVPRAPGAAEDDGWLASYVYDRETDRSDLVLLDAADICAEPVATVHLPARVPAGFHGNWIPG